MDTKPSTPRECAAAYGAALVAAEESATPMTQAQHAEHWLGYMEAVSDHLDACELELASLRAPAADEQTAG